MEPMFGRYIVKKESFERWLRGTPLFKSVHDGGYARVDQRKLSVEIFHHGLHNWYTVTIDRNIGVGTANSSKLFLEFEYISSEIMGTPSLTVAIEDFHVRAPKEVPGQKLGPALAPPNWNVLDEAIEENRATAEKDRALLRLAAREILTAIEQLQEHQLP